MEEPILVPLEREAPQRAEPDPVEAIESEAPLADVEAGDEPEARGPSAEAKAREMGWVPKEEYRGDPSGWRDADEFVRRGEEVLPIVRSNLDRERKRTAELQTKLDRMETDFSARMARLDAVTRAGLKHQAQQIHSSYEAAKRQAVENGDLARYDTLHQQHVQALTEFDTQTEKAETAATEAEAKRAPPALPPDVKEAVEGFIARHDWWDKDTEMTSMAVSIHETLAKTHPGMPITDNLAETEKRIKAMYPEKFKPTASAAPVTRATYAEGGSRIPGSSAPRGKGWADIPADDRKFGEKFISNDGLFLPAGVTADKATDRDIAAARAAYAKEYWSAAQ